MNFFLYIKMSTGWYQKNKERLRKKARKMYQNLSEEEKTKIVNMLVNNIEIFQKMKKRGQLSIEKIILKYKI